MTPRLLKCAIAVLQVTAVLLLSAPGVAQTIMLTDRLTRHNGLRPDEQKPYWVNYQDCVSDDVLFFDIGLTGAVGQLEVWASAGSSADCGLLEERTGTSPDCWQVFLSDATLDSTPRVEIRAQDIVAQNRDNDPLHGPGSGTASDCDRPEVVIPTKLTLFFMFTDGREIVGMPAIYGVEPLQDIGFDVTGPRPPTEVSAGIGENRVILEWTPQAPDDLIGYNFYCDPPRGGTAGTAIDAGAPLPILDAGAPPPVTTVDAAPAVIDGAAPADAATAGATDGSTTPAINPNCPSSAVVAGERPDPAYFCGSTRSTFAASGSATGLSNGTGYAVAVAGVDEIGNVGELSEVVCGSPEVVDDFFELYRRSGGKGGGGFCSIGGSLVAARDGAASPWSALLLAGLGWAARSRLRSPPCGRTDRQRRAR